MSFCGVSWFLVAFHWFPSGFPATPALLWGLCFCGGVSVDRSIFVVIMGPNPARPLEILLPCTFSLHNKFDFVCLSTSPRRNVCKDSETQSITRLTWMKVSTELSLALQRSAIQRPLQSLCSATQCSWKKASVVGQCHGDNRRTPGSNHDPLKGFSQDFST